MSTLAIALLITIIAVCLYIIHSLRTEKQTHIRSADRWRTEANQWEAYADRLGWELNDAASWLYHHVAVAQYASLVATRNGLMPVCVDKRIVFWITEAGNDGLYGVYVLDVHQMRLVHTSSTFQFTNERESEGLLTNYHDDETTTWTRYVFGVYGNVRTDVSTEQATVSIGLPVEPVQLELPLEDENNA